MDHRGGGSEGRAGADLGMQQGDALEIVGQHYTAAIAVPPYPEDETLEIIRLDGLQRANAGVSAGERIEIRPVEARAAGDHGQLLSTAWCRRAAADWANRR